jgi:hypothetical protein
LEWSNSPIWQRFDRSEIDLASNKNQHFVPKTHFKPFSVDAAGRAIHVFNLDKMQAFLNAPVRNQCSRDYFYGRDERLETAIQTVEGAYAKCVNQLCENAGANPWREAVLKRFIYLQHLRTETVAKVSAEHAMAIATVRGSDMPVPSYKDAVSSGVISAMQYYAQTMAMVDDLKLRIVRNETSLPFLTSDDPVVMTNRWHFQSHMTSGLSFGSANAGILFFLPLTPRLLAILMDGDIYSVAHTRQVVVTNRPQDVIACNELQAVHCAANLYFGDEASCAHILDMVSTVRGLRLPSRFEVHKAVHAGAENGFTRYSVADDPDIREHESVLIHVKSIRPVPLSWPSFLSYRVPKTAFTNGTRGGYRRRSTIEETDYAPPWRKVKV